MAKGYLVGTYRSVRDPEKLAAYGKLAKPALEAAGGRILARGGRVTAFESGLAERTVLVEFASYDAAVAAYGSDEYQRAVAVLDGGAERDVRVVEGLD
ncbi:DUF1330 domain-containing protein [Streptacidiphilus fuscans]|uniref:DUF1330 domain-containing protein n=1 Tax=Streptacidiphilus fuscans TaxID=2789292 RepID=A0A931FBQ8_9ACTN|nr:DUF1330 domain-containing protein [Streptacidiphilus fuscans]MBF9067698.1 DUF1330 domain-containing protein [Streptacidiphilus fuscans]